MNESPTQQRELRPRVGSSIAFRVGVGVLLIVCAAFVVALWSVTAGEQREFHERNTREARNLAALITRDVSSSMLAGGGVAVWKHISEEASQHSAASGAAAVVIVNRAGLVKAGTDPKQIGSRIEVDCSDCPPHAPGVITVRGPEGARLRIVSPIQATEKCQACHGKDEEGVRGLVSVDFDLSPLERSNAERRQSILLIGIGSGLALLVMIGLLFRTLVLRPIDALMGAAQRLGSGDLAARAAVPGNTELSLLGTRFNQMAERLESQLTSIRDAQRESALLYTLVVEASKNLETSDVATSVLRVVIEKLRPQRAAFFLESTGGAWICCHGSRNAEEQQESEKGDLTTALESRSGKARAILEGMPDALFAQAAERPEIRMLPHEGQLAFALPITSEGRFIGLLAACGVETNINRELLGNLSAHLALAAANSRNYTGAITDALTGLKNKRYGMARLEEAVFTAKRYGTGLAVAMCDIDHFKRVNDTYGHPAGDAVLREVASRIAAAVRKADLVARYGGEEFMLIFPQAAMDSLHGIGEKVRMTVAATPVPLGEGKGTLAVTMSLGMTALQGQADSAEALIARADAALYRAKQGGRNRLELDS